MKRKMRSWGQLLTSPWQYDIADCFFWLPFFQGSDSCGLLPLDPAVVCYPTAKSGWSQWGKNGFCGLAFTFCPHAAGLHHQKKTLMGPLSPALGATWQIHSVRVCIYLWVPCGPPSIRDRSWSVWPSSRWAAWLGYQLNCIYSLDLFVSKYMFNSTWLFKWRLYNNNKEDELRMTEPIM